MAEHRYKRAVLYTRLSRDQYEREGNNQYEVLHHYCHEHDIKVIHHYCDISTKKKLGRRFINMIEDIRDFDGIDIVLINSVERISSDYDAIIEVAKVLNDLSVHIVVVDSLNDKVKDIKNMNQLLREAKKILSRKV
jgi:DNA invertase Pin-like site-specific DNA recombinase